MPFVCFLQTMITISGFLSYQRTAKTISCQIVSLHRSWVVLAWRVLRPDTGDHHRSLCSYSGLRLNQA